MKYYYYELSYTVKKERTRRNYDRKKRMKKTRKTLIRLQRDNPWSTEKIRDKQGNSRATRESAVLQAQYTAAHGH